MIEEIEIQDLKDDPDRTRRFACDQKSLRLKDVIYTACLETAIKALESPDSIPPRIMEELAIKAGRAYYPFDLEQWSAKFHKTEEEWPFVLPPSKETVSLREKFVASALSRFDISYIKEKVEQRAQRQILALKNLFSMVSDQPESTVRREARQKYMDASNIVAAYNLG